VRYLSTLGVGGAIAGILFFFYRKDVRLYTEQWKGQSELLAVLIKENTAAFAANTEAIRALERRLDNFVSRERRHVSNEEEPFNPERRHGPRR
jgi:hypothetical protein